MGQLRDIKAEELAQKKIARLKLTGAIRVISPSYAAAKWGQIIRIANQYGNPIFKPVKEAYKPNGYGNFTMCESGARKQVRVHRLIARAFLGEPNGLQVDHIDGNKRNNAASNLEYVTQQENIARAIKMGNVPKRGSRTLRDGAGGKA